MTRSFEYISYDEADQLTMSENTAAYNEDTSGQPAGGGGRGPGAHVPDGRTEALINRGRAGAGRSRSRWLRSHLRTVAITAAAFGIGIVALVIGLPGAGRAGRPAWPR